MNNRTASIINSCFNGKMSIVEYLKIVLDIFKTNIKDLALITLAVQIPLVAFSFLKLPSFLFGFIGIAAQVIYIVAVIKLIHYKSQGENIRWIDAIKRVQENWIAASGAIIFQSFLIGMVGSIPVASIAITIILAVAIPMGAIQAKSMFESAIDSFKIVKGNLLDVGFKLLALSAITGLIIGLLRIVAGSVPSLGLVCQLLGAIIGTVQMISSLVLFYNLPTVEKARI